MNGLINNKFLFFKTADAFERERRKGNISPTSIAFIKDDLVIWTHNTYFGLSTSLEKSKGYFDSLDELKRSVSKPQVGDWAIVNSDGTWYIASYKIEEGWVLTDREYNQDTYNLSDYIKRGEFEPSDYVKRSEIQDYVTEEDLIGLPYATKEELYRALANTLSAMPVYQSILVSGQNIKTINNTSLLGSGNIDVITPDNIEDYIPEIEIPEQQNIKVDTTLSINSVNPVQNSAVTLELNRKANAVLVNEALNNKANASDLANKVNRSELEQYALRSEIGTVVNNYVTEITQVAEKAKGYFDTYAELTQAVPSPVVGDWAVINDDGTWVICMCNTDGVWTQTEQEYKQEAIDLTNYAKTSDLANLATKTELQSGLNDKQDTLESGVNIKTLNGESLLGSGNVQVNIDYQYIDERFDALKASVYANNDGIEGRITDVENLVKGLLQTYISWYGSQNAGSGSPATPVIVPIDQEIGSGTVIETGQDSTTPVYYSSRLVTLTTQEYQLLMQQGLVQSNTYYFTYDGDVEPYAWHFGDHFPVIFKDNSGLGTFPITLTDNSGIGIFPITLI